MIHYPWARGSTPQRLIAGTLIYLLPCAAAVVLVLLMFLLPTLGLAAAYGTKPTKWPAACGRGSSKAR